MRLSVKLFVECTSGGALAGVQIGTKPNTRTYFVTKQRLYGEGWLPVYAARLEIDGRPS